MIRILINVVMSIVKLYDCILHNYLIVSSARVLYNSITSGHFMQSLPSLLYNYELRKLVKTVML